MSDLHKQNMSNSKQQEQQKKQNLQLPTSIENLIQPHTKDLGEFSVRRSLPSVGHKMVGPWIFFDHMGPASFSPGEGINVRPHPHIGIATVTYLFEGEILHRDSLGSVQAIQPGDINLMITGKGIVHSERERPEITSVPHNLHGLQLWLALPNESEEVEPAFFHYPSADIPRVKIDDVPVRVMIGSAYGVTSPVLTYSETLYLEANLKAGQSLTLPVSQERAIYVANGKLKIDGFVVDEHSMAVIKVGSEATIEAIEDSQIALIGGESVGKRFIEWNFVSSSKERIERAKQEWKEGSFPKVPGDEEEFIPLPE